MYLWKYLSNVNKNINMLFEVSWEVCNKVGGINTTIISKLSIVSAHFNDDYCLIGPYTGRNDNFIETKEHNFKIINNSIENHGIECHYGRYFSFSGPKVILIDYKKSSLGMELLKNISSYYSANLFLENWSGIDYAYFGALSGFIIHEITKESNIQKKSIAHFHEWMCGSGLLYLKMNKSKLPTIFTTHATAFGRYISKMNLQLIDTHSVEKQAKRMHIYTKYILEKLSANLADCFTTVSSLVAKESEIFLGISPDVITPNGLDSPYFTSANHNVTKHVNKLHLFSKIEKKISNPISGDSQLIIYSGRCEFRNKGLDVLIVALSKYDQEVEKKIVFIGIILLQDHDLDCIIPPNKYFKSTKYNNDYINDTTNIFLEQTKEFIKNKFSRIESKNITYLFIPRFMHQEDGFLNMNYLDILSIADLSIFPSNYEPWGYTPHESAICGVPTITTDKSGFGIWVKNQYSDTGGISVLNRDGISDDEFIDNMKNNIMQILSTDKKIKMQQQNQSMSIVKNMSWNMFYNYYLEAYDIAYIKHNKDDQI